ncbi:MAG: glycerophosphodiester phosphodiesterase [Deltaproteobacteria bacterium]|nr:glycerophosphodiester phosphodiesterase [Deltaproteobacteria bacterium]MBI4223882.1 glycerophosphodiester phosphodiesterase [Deltaproteobacteria bacterium]
MKIFAHRGASIEAPDNSPEAVRKALEIGVDGIEIDCHLGPEGTPVASHDEPTADAVPLAEILKIIRPTQTPVILDFKTDPKKIIPLCLEILSPGQMLASSFKLRHLFWLKQNHPGLARGWIAAPRSFRLVWPSIFGKLLPIRSIHPCLAGLTVERVRQWQKAGWKVYAWVANTEEDFGNCLTLGVDGIFTDDPRRAKEWLTTKN